MLQQRGQVQTRRIYIKLSNPKVAKVLAIAWDAMDMSDVTDQGGPLYHVFWLYMFTGFLKRQSSKAFIFARGGAAVYSFASSWVPSSGIGGLLPLCNWSHLTHRCARNCMKNMKMSLACWYSEIFCRSAKLLWPMAGCKMELVAALELPLGSRFPRGTTGMIQAGMLPGFPP